MAYSDFFCLYPLLVSAWYNGRIQTEETEIALETLFHQVIEGLQPPTEHISSEGKCHE